MPNFRGTRFTNAHETLIWCAQGREGALHLQLSRDEGAQRRPADALATGCCRSAPGSERLKDEDGNKAHPTQKPEALLYRILLACTKPGDVVLDPFFGTGTTGAVARRLGRHLIGIERETAYVKVALQRIASDAAARRERDADGARQALRNRASPFGLLGRDRHGRARHGADRQQAPLAGPGLRRRLARLRRRMPGSIHQVGAALQGAPSCNGWSFWHVEDGGTLQPIDALRQRHLAGLS